MTNFEIQKYYEDEPRFNGVFSRDNLPKEIKDGGIRNKYWWTCRCWYTLDCFILLKNEIVYFDSFGVEHIPEEIKKFIGNKNVKANIYWVQANDSVMCGYFCIGFIDFMFAGKTLIDYTTLFSPHDFNKNDRIILSYLKYFKYGKCKFCFNFFL